MKKSNLGEFGSLKSVWEKYPHGGIEGDYLTIRGVLYEWDKYNNSWGKPTDSPANSPSISREEIDGHLSVDGNLYIGGLIFAKNLTQTSCGLFATLEDLKSAFPSPKEGMWANVGDTMPSPIYRCNKDGIWEATGEVGGVEIPDKGIILEQIQETKRQIEKSHLSKAEAEDRMSALAGRLGYVRFDEFIDEADPSATSLGSNGDAVVAYCRSLKTFLARESFLSEGYHKNWYEAEKFIDPVLHTPYTSKLYVHDGLIYYWDGTGLSPLGLRLGDGEKSAFSGDRGRALEGSVLELQEKSRGVEASQSQIISELSDLTKKQGGSGHYNVTLRHPLSEGYYTLESAVAAISSADVAEEERRGKVMTFEVASGKWVDYRYTGDRSSEQFSSPAFWVVASSIKGVRVGGQLVEPQDGVIDLPDNSIEVADSVDESDRPVASRAVKVELDKLKALTLDADTEPTDEGTQVTLSQEGRQVVQFTVAGGGGGEASTTKAKVTAQLSANRIKLGDAVQLSYGYTHYTDGEQDGLPAILTLVINRGSQLIARESLGLKQSGESGTIDLGKYIASADSYSIKIEASYQEGDTAKTRVASAALSVVDLSISLYNRSEIEAYISAGGYKDGDTANIILSVKGGARSVAMYLDGDSTPHETKTLTGSGSRTTFSVPVRTLRAGAHSLQFVAAIDDLKSNSIYLDILKAGGNDAFVGLIFSRTDGEIFLDRATPVVLAKQYEAAGWDYIAIGTQSGGAASLTYKEGGRTTQFSSPRSYQRYTTRYTAKGRLDASYELEAYKRSFSVEVLASTLQGVGIKEGAIVELLASGRSNIEADPAQWSSGRVTTSFEGVDWRSSGWTGEALRLLNGAKATIGYQGFASDAKVGGITISMEMRIRNVRSYSQPVVSCYDEASHQAGDFGGFLISPEKIKMPTGGRVSFRSEEGEEITRELGLETPFDAGDYYNVSLVIHPSSEQKNIRCYINGVLAKADTYQDTIFRQRTPQSITLDSAGADLEVRNVRIYNTALSDDEVLDNHITDRPTYEEMERLRDRNDVLDPQTGQPSWDKLYRRDKGILSLTLEEGSLELLWGKSTDTKTRYKVKELIFRSPYGRAYDLKVVNAAIRRQGTSTSTYPIKNLRIELQRKGFDTLVYRNVGTEGEDVWELVSERTYTMRPGGKPMSIINLKTDYADSSLCYNTGGAILLNDYLVKANPKLRTPGMVADGTARMAIDGLPIDVFTSSTTDGDKVYCGQFQFNFDKSKSGYLFGQTKKDGSEIALEFINNTNPIANYAITGDVATQLASKGSDGFDASVEFLFPEKDYLWNGKKGTEDTAPEKIKQAITRLWGWVHSCVPEGSDPSKMATDEVKERFKSSKFKSEVGQYFSVDHLALWWVWTDYCMSVDQRVKNTFYRTWDGLIWYLTYYDGDTAFGIRNDAFLAYLYNITRDTWDAQRSKYAFEGRGSRLWALVIANLWDEIKEMASLLRTALTDTVFLDVFDNQIMGNWSERQYNKSQIYKYIKPTYTDYNGGGVMNYIFALKGNMQAYRRQIIKRRFSLLDALYEVGAYHSDAVQGYIGKGSAPTQIKATAGDEYYFGWRTQNGQFRQHQRVETGGVGVFDFDSALSQNDPVRLVGASRMRKIDFATTAPFLQGSWNFNGCPILEEIVAPVSAGSATQWYPLISKISGLKRIDLTGQVGITGTEDEQARTFDVSSHPGLMELKLSGTAVRAIRLAEGAPISRLELPATLSYLRLRALPKLTESGLQVADWSAIRSLELAGCPQLDWQVLVGKCTGLERVRVEGVDMEDDGTLLARLRRLKGIDASGSGVETCSLAGRCQLTKYIDDELLKDYQAHFPELDILQPMYTIVEMDDKVLQHANMSNLDNKTGYKFGTPYVVSGHIKRIVSGAHRVLGKQAENGVMSVIQLHDEDSTKYADNDSWAAATSAKVDGSQGDIWTYFPAYKYKGIIGEGGLIKYAVYTSSPNASSPKGRKITGSELRGMETHRVHTYTGGANISECVRAMPDHSGVFDRCHPVMARIPCSGWGWVSTPVSEGFLGIGVIFFDADNRNIKSVSLPAESDYWISGMNMAIKIPDGAAYFVTCYPSTHANEAYVWLTNSDSPADWEPDWVDSPELLIATLPTVDSDGKLRSVCNDVGNAFAHNNYMQSDISRAESRGGITAIGYEQVKNFVNLLMFSRGTRAPLKGDYSRDVQHDRAIIDMLSIGMDQPEHDQGDRNGGYITKSLVKYKVKWSQNPLGVNTLNGGTEIWLARARIMVKNSDVGETDHVIYGPGWRRIIGVYCDETRRHIWGARNERFVHARYTSFGRYMDLLSTIKRPDDINYGSGQGSLINTRLYQNMSGVLKAFTRNTWVSDSNAASEMMLEASNQPAGNALGDRVGVRLMYDKTIKVVSSIEEYEGIPNNY